jgi:putative peptidoglycan lipid II flippase
MTKDTEKMRHYISSSVMMLTPMLLAVVVGIVLLAEPLVRIMFERGEFSPADTKRTAECLQMYAVLALSVGMEGIVSRGLYALRDTKTPAIISGVAIVAGIVLNFILIGPLKHMGLALSTSLSSFLMMTLTLLATQKRLGSFGSRGVCILAFRPASDGNERYHGFGKEDAGWLMMLNQSKH